MAISLLTDVIFLNFLGGEDHVCSFVLGLKWWIHVSSWITILPMHFLDLLRTVPKIFWKFNPCHFLISTQHSGHPSCWQLFTAKSSLRMTYTYLVLMPTVLAMCLTTINLLLFVTISWLHQLVLLWSLGYCHHGLFSVLIFPCLNIALQSFTMDYEGTSSSCVVAISSGMSFRIEPFLWRFLISVLISLFVFQIFGD